MLRFNVIGKSLTYPSTTHTSSNTCQEWEGCGSVSPPPRATVATVALSQSWQRQGESETAGARPTSELGLLRE